MSITLTASREAELVAAGQMDNPFFSLVNRLTFGAVTGTSSLPDGSIANCYNGSTADYYLPDITGTVCNIVLDLGLPNLITMAFILNHNLGTLGGSLRIEKSDDGSTWITASPDVAPTDDNILCIRMADGADTARYWRLRFTGLTAGDGLYIGQAFLGRDIVMPMRIYKGFRPAIYPTEVSTSTSVTQGNHPIGSSVTRMGSTIQAQFMHIPPALVRGFEFSKLVEVFNSGTPFLFAWRPGTYPDDMRYCWRAGEALAPANSDTLDYMQFQVTMRAYEG